MLDILIFLFQQYWVYPVLAIWLVPRLHHVFKMVQLNKRIKTKIDLVRRMTDDE